MVQCGIVLGHFQYCILLCNLTKTIIVPHLIFAVTCAVQCGLEFSQNHNHTAPHFCSHICSAVYKIRFKRFEVNIFFKFWVFLTQPKTNFLLCFGPSFKLLNQFFFILGLLSQSTLDRIIKLLLLFFFLKIRVIKLLIIYLVLKINK